MFGNRARRVLRHRRCSTQFLRRSQVPCGTGGEAAGDEMLVGGAPHRAGCLARAQPGRALGAVTSLVRFVCGQQRPPSRGQSREFGTRHGQQGRRIRAIGQLGKHIEPLPDRVAQNLSQNRVHRTSPSLSRLISGEPQRGTQLADPFGRQCRGCTGRSGENHPVPVDEHLEGPRRVVHVEASHLSVVPSDDLSGVVPAAFRSGGGVRRIRGSGVFEGSHLVDVLSVLRCLPMTRLERVAAGWLDDGRRPDIPRDERSADVRPCRSPLLAVASPSFARSLNLRPTPEKRRGVFK